MKAKILVALFLVLLMTQAFAEVAITINKPAANTQINNLSTRRYDINVSGTDDNASTEGIELDLVYYNAGTLQSAGTAIVTDLNLFNPSVGGCVGNGTGWTTWSCSIPWDMPTNTNMGDGVWFVDANVSDTNASGSGAGGMVITDKNATNQIEIFTGMVGAQSVRDIMSLVGVVLIAAVIITALLSVLVLKTDPMNTAIIAVVSSIFVAIAAQIIGTVMATV